MELLNENYKLVLSQTEAEDILDYLNDNFLSNSDESYNHTMIKLFECLFECLS